MPESALRTVLLVEDDAVDVMTFKRALRDQSVQVDLVVCDNGVEALEMLRSGKVRLSNLLVLLDLNMPRMGGLELLENLRADEKLRHIPAVVLTTSSAEDDRMAAYDAMVAGYIVKPLTFSKFREQVGRLTDYWTMVELP